MGKIAPKSEFPRWLYSDLYLKLTENELRVLELLAQGPLNQYRIADQLNLGRTSISYIVKRLERDKRIRLKEKRTLRKHGIKKRAKRSSPGIYELTPVGVLLVLDNDFKLLRTVRENSKYLHLILFKYEHYAAYGFGEAFKQLIRRALLYTPSFMFRGDYSRVSGWKRYDRVVTESFLCPREIWTLEEKDPRMGDVRDLFEPPGWLKTGLMYDDDDLSPIFEGKEREWLACISTDTELLERTIKYLQVLELESLEVSEKIQWIRGLLAAFKPGGKVAQGRPTLYRFPDIEE